MGRCQRRHAILPYILRNETGLWRGSRVARKLARRRGRPHSSASTPLRSTYLAIASPWDFRVPAAGTRFLQPAPLSSECACVVAAATGSARGADLWAGSRARAAVGVVVWAGEQVVPSAWRLLISTVPIWLALMGWHCGGARRADGCYSGWRLKLAGVRAGHLGRTAGATGAAHRHRRRAAGGGVHGR